MRTCQSARLTEHSPLDEEELPGAALDPSALRPADGAFLDLDRPDLSGERGSGGKYEGERGLFH
jgi:hypothetical protein